ncbi:MAG: hypothetical protein KJZ87_17755 [Thermoguttaceae bacterium]|nr:hypothetical protein [Thermoguttaceae bacterium]
MKLDRYYYIASLPVLGELGTPPPIGFEEFWERLSDHRRWRELVGSLFLLDDLRQREAYLVGEVEDMEPTVLSVSQMLNRTPLPEYLLPEAGEAEGPSRRIAADNLWEAYFRYVARLAERWRSRFLASWAACQVALRNALASARAERLGLEAAGFLVAEDLAAGDEDFGSLLNEWAAAPTPLAGHQRVLRAEWDWVARHDPHFTFDEDELLVYAVRLILLKQWQRVASNE